MRRTAWRAATVVGAVAVMATAAVIVGVRVLVSPGGVDDAGDPISAGTSDVGVDAVGPGPTSSRHGVPLGWSRDEAGAVAAAVSAVGLTGEVARAGFITRSDMITTFTTARYGPILVAESAAQLTDLTGELGSDGALVQSLRVDELPLTARLVHLNEWSAQVQVWTVTVITVPDVGVPRQVWRTVTVELVWEDADWRVDGWSTRSGPTPALAAHTAVATVDELAEVVGWRRVGGGGG